LGCLARIEEDDAMKRFGLTLVVAVIGLVLGVSTPGALAATECNSTMTGSVTGGVDVGPTDNCVLNGAVVSGGVHMTGGTLEACGSMIAGGVHVTGGTCVTLGKGLDDLDMCPGNSISGGVKVSLVVDLTLGFSCPGAANVELEGNGINGAVRLDNNGTVQVEANTINGSLECSGNVSATDDVIFPNTVTGSKSGQCAGL